MKRVNLLERDHLKWTDIEGPSYQELNQLSRTFSFSSLLLQDALGIEQLPKYELSQGTYFFILRFFDLKAHDQSTTVEEVTQKFSLFIRSQQLISVHSTPFREVTEKIPKEIIGHDNSHAENVHYLVHRIIQTVIRSYKDPLNKLDQMYDELEEKILIHHHRSLDLKRVYYFRRRMFILKKILKMTHDMLSNSKEFWTHQESLLQDLKENIHQIYLEIDDLSQNFEHLFQVYISLNEKKANEVMKVLTTFSTILLPLNFIASFFGMNFKAIPGIESSLFFWFIVMVMITISIILIFSFKRKRWF